MAATSADGHDQQPLRRVLWDRRDALYDLPPEIMCRRCTKRHFRRANISLINRGDAAAATWIVRGDECAATPRRDADRPRESSWWRRYKLDPCDYVVWHSHREKRERLLPDATRCGYRVP